MKYKGNKAFTLVELLVGITIIGIVFGVGVASYREFSRRQELQGYVKSTASDLRRIQQLSLSGEKPDPSLGSCTRLDGYTFYVNSSSSYQLIANCLEGNRIVKSVSFTDINISSTYSSTRFKILGLGTDLINSNVITITSPLSGVTSTITIGRGGDIK